MKIKNSSNFYAYLCHDGMVIFYDKQIQVTKGVSKKITCCIKSKRRIGGSPKEGKTIILKDISLDALLHLENVHVYPKAFDTRPEQFNCDPVGIYIYLEDGTLLSSYIFGNLDLGNARYCSFDSTTVDQFQISRDVVLTHTLDREGKPV